MSYFEGVYHHEELQTTRYLLHYFSAFRAHYAMVQAFWQTSTSSSSSNGGKYSSSRATLRQHTFFYFYFFFLMLERERFSKRRGIGFWYICVTRESSLILPKKYLSIEWSCWSQANFSAKKNFSIFWVLISIWQ